MKSLDFQERGSWLILGSSGYLGSHLVAKMSANSIRTIGVDVKTPHTRAIPNEFLKIDIRDISKVSSVISKYQVEGIINLAALKSVSDSFINPDQYFEVNTKAVNELVKLCVSNNVKYFIQASSAAVYGDFKGSSADEKAPVNPISPYGESKLEAEFIVSNMFRNTDLKGMILRFFNIIGAENSEMKDRSKSNVIPIFESAINEGHTPKVYGFDLETPDGSCVRDYVDVRDVAQAHIDFLKHMQDESFPQLINIGSGIGHSVLEIGKEISTVMHKSFEPKFLEPRLGDPVSLVADIRLAKEFGYKPKTSFKESIKSAIS
jgi:UDP-glucose 4-epimerase